MRRSCNHGSDFDRSFNRCSVYGSVVDRHTEKGDLLVQNACRGNECDDKENERCEKDDRAESVVQVIHVEMRLRLVRPAEVEAMK